MSETNEEILAEIRDDLKNRLGIGNYAIQRLLDMYDELQASHLPSPPEPGKGAIAAAEDLWKSNDDFERPLATVKSLTINQVAHRIAAHTIEPSEHERVVGERDGLVMAVGMKHPGETRYETALRYIQEAEHHDDNAAIAACNPTEQEPTDA